MSKKSKKNQEVGENEALEQAEDSLESSFSEEVAQDASSEEPQAPAKPEKKQKTSFKQEAPQEEEVVLKQKPKAPIKIEPPQRYDVIAYARAKAPGFNETWVASIEAFRYHQGAPSDMTEPECIGFLTKWGVKFK